MIPWLSNFFFNPWMVAGAGAIAGPIIIHILSRRKFRTVRWAAMDFLLQAQKRNRKRVQMEQWIVLALRCLAVLLLALALARPFLGSGWLSQLVGGGSVEHIVLIDDSLSMTYADQGGSSATGTNFKSAVAGCAALVKQIAGENDGDAVSVYLASQAQAPLVSVPNLSDDNQIKLAESLVGLNATFGTVDFRAACSAIAERLRNAPARANAIVYVFSDFQRQDWLGGSGDDVSQRPTAMLVGEGDDLQSTQCMLFDVGAAEPANLSIDRLRMARAQVVAGVPVRVDLDITNHTAMTARDVQIGVAIADRRMPPVTVAEILPGETVTEPIEVTFPQDGGNYAEFELVGAAARNDGLAADNTRAAAFDVVGALNVMIVNGEPSADVYRDEAYLLRTALRPAGRAASGVDVRVADEVEFDELPLADMHVVMLANVARLSPAGLEKLEAFARDGGGVVWFAGDLLDQVYYNDSLYRRGEGLLPLPLGEFIESPTSAEMVQLDAWDEAHPILRGFGGELADVLKTIRFDAFVRVVEAESRDAQVSLETETVTTASDAANAIDNKSTDEPRATVIARLSDGAQTPLLVESSFGKGRVLWVASSADQEWNNWASNFSYLPVMLELVQYMARADSGERMVTVGDDLSLPVDPAVVEKTVTVRPPTYPAIPEATVELTSAGAETVARYEAAERSGLYEFLLNETDGGRAVRYAAVNVDPVESDLRKATESELTASPDPKLKIQYFDDVAKLVRDDDTGRTEFWWPLLVAAIGVLMAEHFLACRFGGRG